MFSLRVLNLAVVVAITLAPHITQAQCTAPANWFPHSSTPEPDFDEPASNCEFHMWAWQEFLWLTQATERGRIRLLDMPTEDDLFSPGRAPAPLQMEMVQRRLKTQTLRLFPRMKKAVDPTSIGHIRQAGSRGVVVDRNGNPLYYASFVSPEYYEFVRTNKFFLRANYLAAAGDLNFPKKAVELKSSWMIVPEGASSDGYFTTTAMVPTLTCLDGNEGCSGANVVVDMTRQRTVELSLIHISEPTRPY